jgi:membrane-bound metal-dependent hydrolase YbcI (DUF457 family)
LLAAHLVPGYFAAVASQSQWQLAWNKKQRSILWVAALASTVIPDSDVIYNWLFRGFFHHSTLWTHSLFVHLGIGLCWWSLRRIRRWPYLQMLMGLVALGGLSHLVLDVVSHSTPLFYPLSLYMVGAPSTRVLEGGVLGYMTDPIFLSEPLFLAVAIAHWIVSRKPTPRVTKLVLCGLFAGLVIFSGTFLLLLPTLQRLIEI